MKVLVLGISGMAGHVIALKLLEAGYEVIGLSRKPGKLCKSIACDASNLNEVRRHIESGDYDLVVNCVGVLNQEAEQNPSRAIILNSALPHLIAETLELSRGRLIHISTDCVFSGKKGDYLSEDIPDASSVYGRSKALGEICDKRNLTFRTSIVGPDMQQKGIGLFNWFMKQQDTVKGYTHAVWTGVTTIVLAEAILAAIQENLTGLYQLVNQDQISKYELLRLFNQYCRNNVIEIQKDSSFCINKSLINTRTDFGYQAPSYEEMVREMSEWIQSHKNLYQYS